MKDIECMGIAKKQEREKTHKEVLQDNYRLLLEKLGPWELFVTITFRQELSSAQAKQEFKYFFKYVNTKDIWLYEKYIFCAIFIEQGSDRDGVHIHALIRGIDPILSDMLQDMLMIYFGQSRVLPYDSRKGAAYYLANKYTSKRLVDYDFIRINSRKRGWWCATGKTKGGENNDKMGCVGKAVVFAS